MDGIESVEIFSSFGYICIAVLVIKSWISNVICRGFLCSVV